MYTLFTCLFVSQKNFVHPLYTLQLKYKILRADCQFLELPATAIALAAHYSLYGND